MWNTQNPLSFFLRHLHNISINIFWEHNPINHSPRFPIAFLPNQNDGNRVHDMLTLYFDDVHSLKSIMDRSEAFISGSFATAIITNLSFMPKDLDFIIPATNYSLFESFLHENGYQSDTSTTHLPDYHYTWKVHHFARHRPDNTTYIDVTESTAPNTDHYSILSGYHSSAVMNAITTSTFTVYFPQFTYRNINIPNRESAYKLADCLQKYERRGFFTAHVGNRPIYIQDLIQQTHFSIHDIHFPLITNIFW